MRAVSQPRRRLRRRRLRRRRRRCSRSLLPAFTVAHAVFCRLSLCSCPGPPPSDVRPLFGLHLSKVGP